MHEPELDEHDQDGAPEALPTPPASTTTSEAPATSGSRPASDAALPTRATHPSSLATLFSVSPRGPEPEGLFLDPPVLGRTEFAPAEPRYSWLQRSVRRARSLFAVRVSVAFLVQSTLAFTVAHFLLFNLSVVRGSSMNPGIHDGDRIVIDPFAYLFGQVERGEVVVLKYPLDPTVDYIKRVIGLPGDEVVIEAGIVWVNGVALDEPYVADADPLARLATRVKPAHYFVLGDNRPRSSDSRDFGQVPAEYVRGRVEVRLWPFDRAGAVR